jgi:hypothetical protein
VHFLAVYFTFQFRTSSTTITSTSICDLNTGLGKAASTPKNCWGNFKRHEFISDRQDLLETTWYWVSGQIRLPPSQALYLIWNTVVRMLANFFLRNCTKLLLLTYWIDFSQWWFYYFTLLFRNIFTEFIKKSKKRFEYVYWLFLDQLMRQISRKLTTVSFPFCLSTQHRKKWIWQCWNINNNPRAMNLADFIWLDNWNIIFKV